MIFNVILEISEPGVKKIKKIDPNDSLNILSQEGWVKASFISSPSYLTLIKTMNKSEFKQIVTMLNLTNINTEKKLNLIFSNSNKNFSLNVVPVPKIKGRLTYDKYHIERTIKFFKKEISND